MTLRELLEEVDVLAVIGDQDREISGVCADSRRVQPGAAFFALRGERADGGSFARAALAAGAVAVVGERGAPPAESPVRVEVAEPRLALAQAAARFFGHPSRALRVVGVTGTNGKTTTTYLMDAIFRAHGLARGMIGTTGYRIRDQVRSAPFTTPEAPELQALLREMVERGVQAVSIEVSSHALVQRRAHSLECDVIVFTNLSHDHLDFHRTLEGYLDAKLMLFDGRNHPRPVKHATAVINLDDALASRVIEAARRGGLGVLTFGQSPEASVRIISVTSTPQGLEIELGHERGRSTVSLPMLGRYNAANAAAAFAAARVLGIPAAEAARGLARVLSVPGRLERVSAGQAFEVVVDYAHTPQALELAMTAMREHTRGRLLLVFGCGGDRDRAKRPRMGATAARLGDRAWVTSDNPRSEDQGTIVAEILAGVPAGARRPEIELDRRAAIGKALAAAGPGDAVLIAGKGHETTQTIDERVLPFDDREVARDLLAAAKGAQP